MGRLKGRESHGYPETSVRGLHSVDTDLGVSFDTDSSKGDTGSVSFRIFRKNRHRRQWPSRSSDPDSFHSVPGSPDSPSLGPEYSCTRVGESTGRNSSGRFGDLSFYDWGFYGDPVFKEVVVLEEVVDDSFTGHF